MRSGADSRSSTGRTRAVDSATSAPSASTTRNGARAATPGSSFRPCPDEPPRRRQALAAAPRGSHPLQGLEFNGSKIGSARSQRGARAGGSSVGAATKRIRPRVSSRRVFPFPVRPQRFARTAPPAMQQQNTGHRRPPEISIISSTATSFRLEAGLPGAPRQRSSTRHAGLAVRATACRRPCPSATHASRPVELLIERPLALFPRIGPAGSTSSASSIVLSSSNTHPRVPSYKEETSSR